jgi:hypothetical protein
LSADGSCHCDGIFCLLVGDCCVKFEVDCPQTTPAGDTATNINLSTSSSQSVDLSLSPLSTTVSESWRKWRWSVGNVSLGACANVSLSPLTLPWICRTRQAARSALLVLPPRQRRPH